MLQTIANLWRLKHLRNRILFTLMVLAVYRIGTYIPVPGMNVSALNSGQGQNALFSLLNMFSGGAFYRFSIFAMSVTPYITASIIVQLLQGGVIARFEEWQKEGESGRQRLTQVTRYLTVGLGCLQAIGFTYMFSRSGMLLPGADNIWSYVVIVITLTAGDTLLMWFGEMITEKGVGNGISLLIFVGILSRFSTLGQQVATSWYVGQSNHLMIAILKTLLLIAGIIIIFALIVVVQQAERKIPIQYAKRVVGRTVYSGQQSYIPIKVIAAGVIPVIFAISLLILPYTIASYFQSHSWAAFILRYLSPQSGWYMGLEVLLIIAFSFFYTHIQINPQQLAEQLQKHAGFIPGVRPGADTETYIVKVINRITVFGSVFLGVISILPFVLLGAINLTDYNIQGTSIIIMVGVAMQTMQQMEGQLLQRQYKGFIR